MKVLVVDGPEKAGKSTLLDAVIDHYVAEDYAIFRHHFNRPQLNHWIHKKVLTSQMMAAQLEEKLRGRKTLIIWDRSQASEAVYSKLLNRGGELAENPLLGEFMYGRPQQALGLRLMMLGPNLETLKTARNKSDHPVDPAVEREAFRDYGMKYGWLVLENEHSQEYLDTLVKSLVEKLDNRPEIDIRYYVGPIDARRIFLKGQTASEWAPFTSVSNAQKFLELESSVMWSGFATTECPREILLQADELVVPDRNENIYRFARYYLNFPEQRIKRFRELFPHSPE